MSAGEGGAALRPGCVSLVGAGPGDPELLTRRAARRLEEADVVLYDALVDPEVLTLAPTARRIFVGKRAGRPAVRQEFINRLLVRAARRGRKVVRLKGGDPFVFGRGGEEALALVAAGVPFEIVPGVSSAIASPALSGIPVTHRGTSTAFVVVSGHSPEAYSSVLGSLAPHAATIVVLMGLGSAADISALLRAKGWAAETPAAVLYGASTSAASTHVGTLAELPAACVRRHSGAPGTIVIGDVVRLRAMLMAGMTGSDAATEHVAVARARVKR
jgi:uroporphyrin-III C-methyltransferase / precorrin-2 dehydrogenase / sirohydrochlorin ferrochelatase